MTKSQALKRAADTQRRLNQAEAIATERAGDRDQAVFAAQQEGASYAELETATGLSTARITQILRRSRQTTTTTQE